MTQAKQDGLDPYQFENHLTKKREKVDEYFDELIVPFTENTRILLRMQLNDITSGIENEGQERIHVENYMILQASTMDVATI